MQSPDGKVHLLVVFANSVRALEPANPKVNPKAISLDIADTGQETEAQERQVW